MPPVGFEPKISAGERPQAARLLRSWVCCECRVLSGRGLCDELITRPEESYRLCCVVVCDLETSRMGAPYIYDISHLRVNSTPKPLNISPEKSKIFNCDTVVTNKRYDILRSTSQRTPKNACTVISHFNTMCLQKN